MNLKIDVRGDAEVRKALRELGASATPALVSSINRVTRDMGSRIAKQASETVNLSRSEIRQYIALGKATKNQASAITRLKVRRVPIELFKPRVEMRVFNFVSRKGKSYRRKLPTIHLRRLRNGPEEYVQPAFPLTQRRSGKLRSGEKVQRRVGEDRERLTRISYFSFPKEFIEGKVLPDIDAFVPPRLRAEIDRALQRTVARRST